MSVSVVACPRNQVDEKSSNLKGLLGFHFGAGINRNNINNLACRFKSPANTHAGREISQTVGSFAAYISSRSIGEMLF